MEKINDFFAKKKFMLDETADDTPLFQSNSKQRWFLLASVDK